MAVLTRRHPALRWAVPVAVIAVATAVTAAGSALADDRPVLPERSAEHLLADVLQPTTQTFSGTVDVTADLGLPELPGLAGSVTGSGVVPEGAASAAPGARLNGGVPGDGQTPGLGALTTLLAGDHTLRVWKDGPERSRVALIGDGEESDAIRNGSDVWLWQSTGKQVLHATLPAGLHDEATASPMEMFGTDPQRLAAMVLAAVGPTTNVATDPTATVAGRAAYQLVATPRTDGSLVERVVVAIDAETHLPLHLDVYSTQRTDPAVSVGFSSISYDTPPADTFVFTPPEGATVTEVPGDLDKPQRPTTPPGAGDGAKPDVTTVGEGWATVAVLTPAAGDSPRDSQQLSGILEMLPQVSGDWGSGRALSGTLFSVLVADDGRIAVGAVPVETLEAALASASSS